MKPLEHQLQRLLRSAAQARPETVRAPAAAPDIQRLLRERERHLARAEVALRPVLQGGLAVACLLLLMTLLVNVRHIERANQDVFAVSEAALTRVSTP